jgi:hypothetical protein
MKRLLVLGVLLAILVGAIGSHGNSSIHTTAVESAAPVLATPASARPAHHAAQISYTRCDQNISVGPHTTCGFADNVFRAFASKISTEGSEPADYTLQAVSPATGRTYATTCRTAADTTRCTGGNGAIVRFPTRAAEVYSQPSSTAKPPTTEPPQQEDEAAEEEPESTEPSAECTSGTYVNSAGNTVCRPEQAPTAPAGATAECEDGTYSFSESRSGTCSHHGGVAKWL